MSQKVADSALGEVNDSSVSFPFPIHLILLRPGGLLSL
jgi:hypothetical protein